MHSAKTYDNTKTHHYQANGALPVQHSLKPPPTTFMGEVDTGRAAPQKTNSRFISPDIKRLPVPLTSKKTIASAVLKAICPQISYAPGIRGTHLVSSIQDIVDEWLQ